MATNSTEIKKLRKRILANSRKSFRRLFYGEQLIKMQALTLKDYIQENIDNTKEKQKTLNVELEEAINQEEDDEYRHHLQDLFLDENLKYYDEYPKFFTDASLVILYSFFEYNLHRICKLTQADLNANGKNNIRAFSEKPYVGNSKMFLEKECNIKLSGKENLWKKIDKIRDYRNFITHNNSSLALCNDKVAKRATIVYINRVFKKPIEIDHLNQCHIKKMEWLLEVWDILYEYLLFVISKARKKSR